MSIMTSPATTMVYCGRKALVEGGATVVQISGITDEALITPDGSQYPLGAATLLPLGGECIAAELTYGTVSGRWLGLVEPREPGGAVSAWVLDAAAGIVTYTFTPAAIDARTSVTAGCVHGDAQLADALVEGIASRTRTGDFHRARMDTLVSDAHEWADNNSLCSEFDNFMEQHGLPGRERDFCLRVDVSTTVYLTGTGSTLQEAIDSISGRDVVDEIDIGALSYDIESDD